MRICSYVIRGYDIDYAAAEILAFNSGRYVRFDQEKPVLKLYKFYYSNLWQGIILVADLLLLILPCIEDPPFFKNVHIAVVITLECISLTIMFIAFILSMYQQNRGILLKEAVYPYVFCVVFLLNVIDMITFYTLKLHGKSFVRWSRPLRVLYPFALQTGQNDYKIEKILRSIRFLYPTEFHLGTIRRIIRNILRTLPNIANVLFLFLLSILSFTLVGVGIIRKKGLRYPDGSLYFIDYFDTAWDLYVLTTTANNPDVMMPAFNESILYCLFFIGFLLVNLYLFMNLLLAVTFSNYKQHLQ
ncbi:unnamed protein product, partial [Didymodactylos carnosus]